MSCLRLKIKNADADFSATAFLVKASLVIGQG